MNFKEATNLTHLIMVPGHGVTITESLDGADSRDDPWFLLDYQKNKDVPRALVGHIRRGLEELGADRSALLLFSGEVSLLLYILCVPMTKVGNLGNAPEVVIPMVINTVGSNTPP